MLTQQPPPNQTAGSTAYSMSAGGSMVHPGTYVCPFIDSCPPPSSRHQRPFLTASVNLDRHSPSAARRSDSIIIPPAIHSTQEIIIQPPIHPTTHQTGIQALLLTPICPHSLSFRPLIFPDSATISLRMPSDVRSHAWVSFDGRFRHRLMDGDVLEVRCIACMIRTCVRRDDNRASMFA